METKLVKLKSDFNDIININLIVTGVTAGIYGISSIATTTNPNDTLVLDLAPGTNTTADKVYQMTVGNNFALKNKIRLIYSATSASLGNKGKDMNLSPYAFTKSNNLELLVNLKKWFNFKYEVIYFYNVYGPRQICKGEMATVVGIFEEHFKRNQRF